MIKQFFIKTLKLSAIMGLIGLLITILLFWYYSYDLPDYTQLAVYDPPVMTRIHANDGRLFAAFATEKRVFVPIANIPALVKNTFVAVEDKNFYSHKGIDPMGILRAALVNVAGFIRDPHFKMGGSTITQQVAKNFCLTSERTISRKIKEAILAFRIEKAFSKDKILELYLNEIYFGGGAYGVGSAASEYFGKSLSELKPEEVAFLAALPKAPSRYNPLKHMGLAKARRDWVITRMHEENLLTQQKALYARASPLVVNPQFGHNLVNAPYYAEHIRQFLIKTYGQDALYKGGLSVRTTLDPHLQEIAEQALQKGLMDYDRQVAGWRGPVTRIGVQDWRSKLPKLIPPKGMLRAWKMAVVLSVKPTYITIGLADSALGQVDFEQMKWARQVRIRSDTFYTEVIKPAHSPEDVVAVGDVILVQKLTDGTGGYNLEQIPAVNGALIAMDPHTGKVLALTGGFSFEQSEFNRALQALRQTGSSFKPFVYMTALENGMTPATILLDAPVVIDLGHDQGIWKPTNITDQFHGENTLRKALEHSYNASIIRLAQQVGMRPVAELAIRFGIFEQLPQQLSAVLGAAETTLIKLTTAFGMIVNGGLKVSPVFIERIQDRHGKTIFKGQNQECPPDNDSNTPPILPDNRPSVVDPVTAYQIVSILEGAVKRGTGKAAQVPGQILGGKTGTTNNYKDSWFVGFTPDLVVGLYVGYDVPKTLGKYQTGSKVAAPIFGNFMKQALEGKRPIPFRIPAHAKFMRINAETGKVAKSGDKNTLVEVFKPSDKVEADGTTLPGSTGNDTTAYNNTGIY